MELGHNVFIIPQLGTGSSDILERHLHHHQHVHVFESRDQALALQLPTYANVTQNYEEYPKLEFVHLETPPPNYEDILKRTNVLKNHHLDYI